MPSTTSFINIVQDLVHAGSLIGIGVIVILLFAGLVKPSLFKRFMRSFTDRKYIAGLGIFLCFFSATIFVATDVPHHDLQQEKKPAHQQAITYEFRPETSPNVIEEAQIAPASPQTQTAGSPAPNSDAEVQGTQYAPEMHGSTNLDEGLPANEQASSSAGQSAQSPVTAKTCTIKLLRVCL